MQPAWERSRTIIRSGLVHDRSDARRPCPLASQSRVGMEEGELPYGLQAPLEKAVWLCYSFFVYTYGEREAWEGSRRARGQTWEHLRGAGQGSPHVPWR